MNRINKYFDSNDSNNQDDSNEFDKNNNSNNIPGSSSNNQDITDNGSSATPPELHGTIICGACSWRFVENILNVEKANLDKKLKLKQLEAEAGRRFIILLCLSILLLGFVIYRSFS